MFFTFSTCKSNHNRQRRKEGYMNEDGWTAVWGRGENFALRTGAFVESP